MSIIAPDDHILAARRKWIYRGETRPPFAEATGDGEESVWDFPRPPVIEPVSLRLRVFAGDELIAETTDGVRVCETAGAPTYYFPPDDVLIAPVANGGRSICEWKGLAEALDVAGVQDAAWRYAEVFEEFASIRNWPSFYPNRVTCYVGDDVVTPQPGGYYGGWVTPNLKGPIKGEPGSGGW